MFRRIVFGAMCALTAMPAFAQGRQGPAEMFEQADADGDGLLSLDEFRTARQDLFGKRDRNADGQIDEADMPHLASARPRAREAAAAVTAQLDLNRDGKVTKDEFVEGAVPLFSRADTNADGVLDVKERDEAKAKMKQRFREMREG